MRAFIQNNGVTVCPPMGSRELAELHVRRERERQAAGGWGWGGSTVKRKRRRS